MANQVRSETKTGGHLWENNSTNVYYGTNVWEIAGVVLGAVGLTLAIIKTYFSIRKHCHKQGGKRLHRRMRYGQERQGPWDSMRLRDVERRHQDFEEEGRRIMTAISMMQQQLNAMQPQVPLAIQSAPVHLPAQLPPRGGGYPGNPYPTRTGYPGNPPQQHSTQASAPNQD